jgi:archaellum component FlaD/FlaE
MAATDEAPAGFTAEPGLQAKLDSLDDNLQPLSKDIVENDKSEEVSDAETEEKNEDVEEVKETNEAEESKDDAKSADESEDTESTEESEGYTIDENDEDEEEVQSNSTQENAQSSELTPEQQYILDNVKPIKVRGYVGDSDKLETFDILAPEQLPDGFRFVDDKERTMAVNGLSQLEQKALQLQNDYRNQRIC